MKVPLWLRPLSTLLGFRCMSHRALPRTVRPGVETLEDRTQPAGGVTIITHGYIFGGGDPDEVTDWVRSMTAAVEERLAPASFVFLDYRFGLNELRFTATDTVVPTSFTPAADIQYVVATFWAAQSDNLSPGWAEAAGDGLYGALRRYGLTDGVRPIHFIGHSFGTVVNSEAIQRLGYFDGIQVDQMTTLDPHDFSENLLVDNYAQMPDVQVWSNVRYADNYWEQEPAGGIFNPHGRLLDGAKNIELTWLPGFHNGISYDPHSRTHKYYLNTIDDDLIDNQAILYNINGINTTFDEQDWYTTAPEQTGYYYALGGGAGDAARQAYFASSLSYRVPLTSPPANPEDVGKDPPARFFNGDFFITSFTGSNLAGYALGQGDAPRLTSVAGPVTNFAAKLDYIYRTFRHASVYLPLNVTGLSFDFKRNTIPTANTLVVTLRVDGTQTYEVNVSDILTGTPTGTFLVDQSNFPTFNALLRGKRVEVGFALRPEHPGGDPLDEVLIDNLNLRLGVAAPQPEVAVIQVGNGLDITSGTGTPLSFGNVVTGQAGPTRTFRVINEGQGTLTLGAVNVPTGFTVIQNLPPSLAPGASAIFVVRLDSTVVGQRTGEISFSTNDANENPFHFSIVGTVTAAGAKADLALDVVDAQASAVLGSTIPVRCEVHNGGVVASGGYELTLWLSSSPVSLTDARLLKTTTRPGLPAGGHEPTTTELVQLPGDVETGTYFVIGVLRPLQPTNEEDDGNHQMADTSPILLVAPNVTPSLFQFPTGTNPRVGSVVTQHFGQSNGHLGTDFRGAQGDPVYVVADGDVVAVFDAGTGWDQVVIIRHNTTSWGWTKDVYSMYAHVAPLVARGMQVRRGDRIATVGPKAAGSTAPHLHFEVRSGAGAGALAGPGYSGAFFDRTLHPFRDDVQGYNTTWHDPYKFITENLFAPPPQQIDFDPSLVSTPTHAARGMSISVLTEVQNLWPAFSGAYQVRFVLSTNPNITGSDRTLKTVLRPGIAGNGTQRWTETVLLPADVAPGTYYVGIIADADSQIAEVNETNNVQAGNAIVVTSVAPPVKPDLRGDLLELQPDRGTYAWGQQFTLAYNVRNAGTAASPASTVRFSLVDNPLAAGFEQVLGTRTVGTLAAGGAAGGTVRYTLPSSPPAGYNGGPLFVRMTVDANSNVDEADETNNSGQGQGQDWVNLRVGVGEGHPDLIGVSMAATPQQGGILWGETVAINYTFRNQGTVAAASFNTEFVLSRDARFDTGDYLLRTRSFQVLNAGGQQTVAVTVTLPPSAPPGFLSGTLYIGAILDPERRLDEANETNNSGLGRGVDYLRLSIVPPPPPEVNAAPVIGTFVVPPSAVRGQRITLSALGVTDDVLANEVAFYADANDNGQLDASDQYLAHGSKNGTTFTVDVNTTGWPLGATTLFAQARDNHGLLSAVKAQPFTLLGLGPVVDDAYENNDALATAHYLGGAGNYHLVNLARATNDDDYFSFDILGGNAGVLVDITFTQEAPQAGQPVGDLELFLLRADGTTLDFSSGSAGIHFGHERIVVPVLGQGRYYVQITGAGGVAGNDVNPNYTLDVQAQPPANFPVPGTLSVNTAFTVAGAPVVMTLDSATVAGGATVDGVHFYVDKNLNGQIEFDNEYLGTDWGMPDGPGGWTWTATTATWPLGANRLIALVSDNTGRNSLATYATMVVQPNTPPTLTSLNVPPTAIQGGTALLSALGAVDVDPGGSVTGVAFTLDANQNGVRDAGDYSLGNGTFSAGAWNLTVPTADWTLGPTRIFATPYDNVGLAGESATATLTTIPSDNQQPVIGGLSGQVFLLKGTPLALTAGNVTDPDGQIVALDFYRDTNNTGMLDAGDQFLGNGTQNGNDWQLTVATSSWLQGQVLLFARASDNGVPVFSSVASLAVTIIDPNGARVLSQEPATSVSGSVDSVRVTFNEPVDPTTFTTADITAFTGPGGPLTPLSVTPLFGTDNTQFEIRFARQTAAGTYSLVIGPDVLDTAGNLMDQDNDGVNGEAGADGYSLNFTLSNAAVEFSFAQAVTGMVSGYATAVDGAGNVLVAGDFRETVDFDPGPGQVLRSSVSGSTDLFLAKFSSAGALLWVQTFGGDSFSENCWSLAVDGAGNAIIAGFFSGSVDFDPGPGSTILVSAGNNDAYVAKFASNGNFVWAKQVGGANHEFARGVAVDAGGTISVVGGFYGTGDFDPGPGVFNMTSSGFKDAFVLRLTAAGDLVWSRQLSGNSQDEEAYGVAVDGMGNVYATGSFFNTVDFDPGPGTFNLSSAGGDDIFLVKLDAAGNLGWAKSVGGSGGGDNGWSVTLDASNGVYAVGAFFGTVDFNPGAGVANLTSAGGQDIYVLKLDTSGNYVWARGLGSSNANIGYDVTVGGQDVYVTGYYAGSAEFTFEGQTVTLTSAGGDDIFVARLDSTGTLKWAGLMGGGSGDQGRGIAVDASNAIYTTGSFGATADFDPGGGQVLVSGPGMFLSKLVQPPPNTPPTLNPVGNRSGAEGQLLQFTVTATDPEAPGQTLTYSLDPGAPAGAAINPTTGVFTWTPTEAQGPGTYTLTIRVTDSSPQNASAAETIQISVTEANLPPVLAVIGNRSVFEGVLLTFTAAATDPDLPANALTYSLIGAPAGAAINAATGVFTWIPSESQGPGTFTITVRVTDNGPGSFFDEETIQVTVAEANTAPSLNSIGNRTVSEGSLLAFTAASTDPDLPTQTLSYTLVNGPAGAAINSSTGLFTWTPTEAQGPGTFQATIRVTDNGPGNFFDEETFQITVQEINVPPTLNAIGNRSVNEGVLLTFTATASDTDLPAQGLSFSLVNAPAGASIDSTTGVFTWTPTEAQGPGTVNVTIRVTDNGTGNLFDEETIQIAVNEVNQAPVLDSIGNQSVAEGVLLTFTATATDPDLPANLLSFSLLGAPAGAVINTATGVFTWTPTETHGPGTFTFTIRVTDSGTGNLFDEETIQVVVAEANVAPTLNPIGNRSVNEGSLLTFTATATDPDLPANTLSFTLLNAPTGVNIDVATGQFTWTPAEAHGPGVHTVTVRVTDNGAGSLFDEETIQITVNEVNQAPVLDSIGNRTVNEGSTLAFSATATDADLPANDLTFSLVTAPAGAVIDAQTGNFTWMPAEAHGPGVHTITVRVTDNGAGSLFDEETIQVTVQEVNQAPVLNPIGDKAVAESTLLTFVVTATDADVPAHALSYTLVNGPAGAAIDTATGIFTWTPAEVYGHGIFTVTIRVTDSGSPALADEETIQITVSEVNTAPILAAIGSQTVGEGAALTFTAVATDQDLPLVQTLSFSLSSTPVGASIDSATGVFNWMPTEAQGPGTFNVTIRVTDNGTGSLFDEETIQITVTEVNQVPVLDPIGNRTVNEGETLTFTAVAADPDVPTNGLTFSLVNAPVGASINSSTGVFTWTPTEVQGPGTFTFTVRVTDGGPGSLMDEETVQVTVNEVNQPPVMHAITDRTVLRGQTLTLTASATDPDVPDNNLVFSLLGGPAGASIDASTGVFSWTPATTVAPGRHTVTVGVSDGGNPTSGASTTFQVLVKSPLVVFGANQTQAPLVRVWDSTKKQEIFSIMPYESAFKGGVRVATGDVNGDGVPDIITAPGPGRKADIKVFDGNTGTLLRFTVAGDFLRAWLNFTGGVFVAAADFNGDQRADIVVARGAGATPEVRVFNGVTGQQFTGSLGSFFPYANSVTGGVYVATADFNNDEQADIITSPGSGSPLIRVWSGSNPTQRLDQWTVSGPLPGYGFFVTAADLTGDGKAEVIVSPTAGSRPLVRIYDRATPTQTPKQFQPEANNYLFAVRIGITDLNLDGKADLLVGTYRGTPTARVRCYDGQVLVTSGQELASLDHLFANYQPALNGNLFVGGSM